MVTSRRSRTEQRSEERLAYDYERRFKLLPSAVRLALVFVLAANAAFGVLDLIGKDEVDHVLIPIRIAAAILSLPLFALVPIRPVLAALLGCYVTGAMLIAVIFVAGGATGNYAPGLMLLFVGIPVLLPFSPREAALAVVPLDLLFIASSFLERESWGLVSLLVHHAFPFAAAVECVFSCYILDRIRFKAFLDRREVERARDELAKLDELKTRFTANVHHELRTPLTLISGSAEALSESERLMAGPESALIASISRGAQRLLRMIDALLDLSRIESGTFRIERKEIFPDELFEDVATAALATAQKIGVSITMELTARRCIVDADPVAIESVLMNLLANSLKFTDSDGLIRVRSWQTADTWEAAVEDSGIGIPIDQLERVFDRFVQVEESDLRRYEGAGLGLSIAKELVGLHGGHIWAESEGVGKGTTMRLRLPLVSGADASFRSEHESAPRDDSMSLRTARRRSWASGVECDLAEHLARSEPDDLSALVSKRVASPTGTVLHVDDHAGMRSLIRALLQDEFEVISAANGVEALARLKERRPDVVITDQMMPYMSGLELCEEVQKVSGAQPIPILVLSAKDDVATRVATFEAGAVEYLGKPFSAREVRARAHALVRLARLQTSLAEKNDALESANRELGSSRRDLELLVRALTHDLRSPIVAAGEGIRVFLERGTTDRLLTLVDQNLARAEAMIDGLRWVVTSAGRQSRWERTTLEEIVGGVLADASLELIEGAEAGMVVVDNVGGFVCQPERVKLVLKQLIKNSIVHSDMADAIEVHISASRRAGWIEMVVRDNGPGISPDLREKIFEPFTTGLSGGRSGGLGLGLTVAREVMSSSGGRLVLGESTGRGATFIIELPDGSRNDANGSANE